MPLTVGLMFVEKSVTESKRNQALRLFNGVRDAFEKGVYKVGWLDARTRDGAIIKVANMINIIAVPGFATDRKALEQRYAGVVQSANTAAFLISCQKNLVRNNLRLLDVPAKRTEWGRTSSELAMYMVNAFYDRTKNRMVVLGGIMAEPFLYDNVPNYINFGKLGAVIGHEMLHGFDSHGWYFDKYGNIAPWGTPNAQKAFNRNSKCLVEQYNKYPYGTVPSEWIWDPPKTYYVNGTQTLAENIADNGGLKYAYQAYMDWAAKNPSEKKPESLKLSQKQLFFLSYGQLWCRAISDNLKSIMAKRDTHSPNMYRVLGSVTNFKEFGKAYSCRSGSKMNPTRRCEFW